ncbi:putative serine dehydratase domain-containing protein [Multifurca ochricompacta]|uniref:D-serine dehydratase n=1 Tax=Multifurca ochricompacta TaxID=376703 RepID=A0AAD4MDN5_9AGAM|nr:putative serine dehydratase domain-containing protein [Multifurca ochricompacta]
MSTPLSQSKTPFQFVSRPQKSALVAEFIGKQLQELRTPALVIDRAVFAKNCAKMHANALGYGAEFRAHLKTHKTVEGTRLQLLSDSAMTHAVVVSTLMEAWEVVKSSLVSDGIVKDILYGLPVAINKIADLSELWDEAAKNGAIIRLLVDHPKQIEALEHFEKTRPVGRKWSVFVKVDMQQKRAGVVPGSPGFESLVKDIHASLGVSLYGFYCHAGNSYASISPSEASSFLSSEVEAVNEAARLALDLISGWSSGNRPRFVLSIGSTPTAHSASAETRAQLQSLLYGTLELHAGNYAMLDLQQLNTGLIGRESISQKILATVISYYPGRGANGTDEALCDAGGIAMSKDTGPIEGYGEVIGKPWKLGRISQEHGVLTRTSDSESGVLEVGSMIEIIGQHACLIAAAHPWYYITDSSSDLGNQVVVDIWIPWKGW